MLGCGVDVVCPRGKRAVFEQIRDTGLLVSEYPPGTRPATWRFPARNAGPLYPSRFRINKRLCLL